MSFGDTRFCRVGMDPPYPATRHRSNGDRSGSRGGRSHALTPAKLLDDGPASSLIGDALRGKHRASDPLLLAQEPEQHVLRPDVVVSQVAGLTQGQLERLLGARSEWDMADPQALAPSTKPEWPGNGCPIERSRPEGLLHPAADLLQIDTDGFEGVSVALGCRTCRTSAHDLDHRGPGLAGIESQPGEDPGGHSGVIRSQAEQEV